MRKKTKASTALVPSPSPEPVSFFNWPGSIDRVCARICSGGTLVNFCKEFNQNYQSVLSWIEESDDRRKRYMDALRIRKHHQREILMTDLMELRGLDIQDCCYDNGFLKPLSEIHPAARRWISRIETMDYYEGAGAHRVRVGELKKVWLHDKIAGIKMLVDCLKMIDDDKSDKPKSIEDILEESWGRSVQVETVTAQRVTIK